MKIKVLLIIILFNINSFAQTYTLDNSFGNSGIKRFGKVFYPKKGLLINNNYYFISPTSIAKVNYSGQLVNSFGTNGIKLLQLTNENLSLLNFTFDNNYFYLYGSIKDNSLDNDDIFICKIDENGNYDTSFGVNGKVRLDFGLKESISDFIIQPSGTLYCTGTRLQGNGFPSSLLLFKINNNGTVNTTFDSNGYKEINPNIKSSGGAIIFNDGNYFLLGSTSISGNLYNPVRIMLTKVDENGNIITSYGTSGFTLVTIPTSATYLSIYEAQLFDNKFYVNLNLYSNNNHDALFNFDATTGESLSYIGSAHKYYQKVDNDGLYMTHYYPGSDILNNNNTFNLSKLNPNGILDTTFNNTGVFFYEFDFSAPLANDGDSQSMIFIKEPNGKFLIAGFTYDAFISTYSDFSAIRITDSSLGVNNASNNKISVYPNPFQNKVFFKSPTLIKKIEVYDLIGRKIIEPSFEYDNTSTSIDLSKITVKGNYLIKILTENDEIITEKIVKN